MGIKVKAAIETVKILSYGIMALALVTWIVDYFTKEQVIMGLQISAILFIVYMIYSLNVSNLEIEKVLSKMNDTENSK